MDIRAFSQGTATRTAWLSYAFMAVVLVLVGVLHLGFPFIAALFAYLALMKLMPPREPAASASVVTAG